MLKKLLASLSLLLLFAAVGAAQTTKDKSSNSTMHVEHHSDQIEDRWNWHHVDDQVDLSVTIRGKVEFADDYSDITAITPANGELRVSERRGGVTRKFEATQSADGIKRTYSVNGESRPLDAEGRAWLTKILNDTVRRGGYDAPTRVTRLLQRGGPAGVLAEISQLEGDYIKRVYFNELLKQGNLDAATARRALQQAAREISSDYEKTEILTRMSGAYLRDDRFRSAYLEGASTIHSDYERGRAFKAVLKKDSLNKDNLLFVLKSSGLITSDYEKAELLVKVTKVFPLDEDLQVAFVDAAQSIKSDYEKGRAIKSLLDTDSANQRTWLAVVKGARTLDSDYEKAQLLIRVADAGRRDEAVRNALTDAARGIQSEHERGRVLSAIYK